jgi:DnaJ-class molecular chaperone
MSQLSGDNRDYYQILGVVKTASAADISSAYHALARSCHPDLVGDQQHLVAKFKLASEAYETLSDARKRREYDRRLDKRRQIRPSQRSSPTVPAESVCSPPCSVPPLPAVDSGIRAHVITADVPVTPEEAALGAWCELVLKSVAPCPACQGSGYCDALPCSTCARQESQPTRQTFAIRLPRGVRDGTILHVQRPTSPGSPLATCADLRLCIRIRPSW